MKTMIIRTGASHTIRAIVSETEDPKFDKCLTLQFFRAQSQLRPEEMDKLAALLTDTAKNGPPHNDQKFKNLSGTDGICEFKTPGGLRLLCFKDDGNLIICSHGFLKRSKKTPKREIDTAEQTKSAYHAAKKQKKLHHGPLRPPR